MSADELGRRELEWKELMRNQPLLRDGIEDAMLAAMAEHERENPKTGLTRPTWAEVKRAALSTGSVIEYVDQLPDTTEMRYFKAVSEDGTKIEGFVPVELPEEGVRVKVGGVPGILYLHPDGEVHLDETEPAPQEAELQQLMALTKIDGKLVNYNMVTDRVLYGISLNAEFVAHMLEAWEHVGHGGPCQEMAESWLSRFMEQFIGVLRDSRKEGT